MAIRNIIVNDYRYTLGETSSQHADLSRFVKERLSYHLGNMKAETIDVYNMGGIEHEHNAGAKERRLIIFLNATAKANRDIFKKQFEEPQKVFGIESEKTAFLLPKGNIGTIITSDEGVPIAEWNKQTWELNILFDVFDKDCEANRRIFDRIIKEFKEKVVDQMEKENSWKYTNDKTSLTRYILDTLKRSNDRQIQEDRNAIRNLEDTIISYRRDLKYKYDQLIVKRKSLEAGEERIKGLSENLIKDLDLIVQNEKVEDFHIKDNKFTLFTKDIYITSDRGNRYYGGKYRVEINLENTDIRIYGSNPRRGFWTSQDPHPHVSGSSGMPCLGNVASTIAELCSQTQLYALVLICIDYLESANTADPAGKNVTNWDAVDEEGNILSAKERQDLGNRCACCGESYDDELCDVYESITYDEEDDSDYELYGHHRVCQECRDNNYSYDEDCDEYIQD